MGKWWLAPAAYLYKLGVTFRHRLFDWGVLRSETFPVPVICIGNITVGGTGKTPMAEMVIGYMGRTTKDFYKEIELRPMPYGQALAILFLMEYRWML